MFSTKYRRTTIRPESQEQLYQYIGGIIREKEGVLLEIGGVEDHIHMMASIPPTLCFFRQAEIHQIEFIRLVQ